MIFLTDQLFFDTDCISSFLWTDKGCLLTQLYPKRIVIPKIVLDELSRVHKPKFTQRLTSLLNSGEARTMDIDYGTEAFSLFRQMTTLPAPGKPAIGNGEASALALAKEHSGIIASNNFRDIKFYIRDLELQYLSTGDILFEAFNDGLLSPKEAELIWKTMLEEDCWIGAQSFEEYMNKPYKPLLNNL